MIPFNMGLNTDKAVEQETVTEAFEGYAECPLFAQECRIVLETDGLVFAGRFQQVDVMYGEITAIHLADYLLTLTTDSGRFKAGWQKPIHGWLRCAEEIASGRASCLLRKKHLY